MIRELKELDQHGQLSRCVDELAVPVEQWRALIRKAARSRGWQVRTWIDNNVSADGVEEPWVWVARTDLPAPDPERLRAAINSITIPGLEADGELAALLGLNRSSRNPGKSVSTTGEL